MVQTKLIKERKYLCATHGNITSEGGYSHVKAYGDVSPKLVSSSPKIPRQGSHFSHKILRRGSYFTFNCKNIVKSAIFRQEKNLDKWL